jgi:aspartyl protease family protein
MRNLIMFAVVGLVIAGAATKMADKLDTAPPHPDAARPGKKPASAASANMLAVPGDRHGHFRVNAIIGGRSIEFLVDTGASVVALTSRDAARLGLKPAPRDFSVHMQTANGVVKASRVRLAAIEVGPLTVQDVNAVVMPAGVLGQNLLGMTFLSRLRRFEFRTGQLVLEQ